MGFERVLIQGIVNGIFMGGVYSLLTVGMTLILGVMDVLNFAHCSLMMVAMYSTYWLLTLAGIDPYVSLLVVIPLFFCFGVLIQRFLIDKIMEAGLFAQFILTFGLMLVIENIALLLWGSSPRTTLVGYLPSSIVLGNITVSIPRFVVFVFSLVIIISLYLFLKNTDAGRAIRASSQEKDGALLVGISIKRIYYLVFGLGTGCAGVAGTLLVTFIPVVPTVGRSFDLLIFVVLVLGGMKSFIGAIVGGLIIGIVQSLGTIFIPGGINAGLMTTFLIFITMLLFRPQGIFGKK
jgi:branched-chain amino acid transport system permease protein